MTQHLFLDSLILILFALISIALIYFTTRRKLSVLEQLKSANLRLEREIYERTRAEEKLSFIAYHDVLTGLPNRSFFQHSLEQILLLNKRHPQHVVVLFINIDRFKQVNDSFGHEAGDLVLQQVGERLRECARVGNVIARLSGDEFGLIILNMAAEKDIENFSTTLLEKFYVPFLVKDEKIFITVSIGISLSPENGDSADDLMKNSDIALFQAKTSGKNKFQFSNTALQSFLLHQAKIGMDLRSALERGEFELYYQPKVDLRTGRVTGLEALIRWQQAEMITLPGEFIPIAEENGLIIPIGEWVLKRACIQIKSWADNGYPPISIAVNVSARQFQSENLLPLITSLVANLNLDPKYIEIEITESVLMLDIAKSINLLHQLKAFGVTIAIDDFGTGYSSFNYLKRFEVDKIKIDRTFVSGIVTSTNDAAIVKAIISMAHSMGIKVIAEGVETREQVNFLKTYLCDEIQGFFLGEPSPPERVETFLQNGKVVSF